MVPARLKSMPVIMRVFTSSEEEMRTIERFHNRSELMKGILIRR
jgi:hypothetical protein